MGNDLKDDGGKAIAAALEKNNTLEDLEISWNKIGPDVGKAFANMLKVNKTLKDLW